MSKIILRPIDFTLVATQSIATGSYALGFDLAGDLVKKDKAGGVYPIGGGTSSFGYTSSGIYQIDNTPILTYTYINTIDLNNRVFYGSTGSTVASWSSNSNDGIVYDPNYVTNFGTYSLVTKQYVDSIAFGSSKFSINDKDWSALNTASGSIATASNSTITDNPIDGSYVTVYVNGQEFNVGNGTSSSSCFFAGASGYNYPRGFSASHINGKVQTGDYLYWNDVSAGFTLTSGWRISLMYLTS